MPIGSILKKFLGTDEADDKEIKDYEDNEVLFCKNNVCVHPPALVRHESDIFHNPGYLTVTTKTFTDQYNNAKRPTLFLTWIPNTTLRKCPSAASNGSATGGIGGCTIFSRQNSEDSACRMKENHFDRNSIKNGSIVYVSTNTNPFLEPHCLSILNANDDETHSNGSYSDDRSLSQSTTHFSYEKDDMTSTNGMDDEEVFESNLKSKIEDTEQIRDLKNELQPLLCDDSKQVDNILNPMICHNNITSVNITIANPRIQNASTPIDNEENFKLRSMSVNSIEEQLENNPNWVTPELLAYRHNLSFPESATASPIISRKSVMKCRRFSVDLSQMRSLRLFFNDENCTSGQLVIASRESQYKILHFHHGGLDHLAQVLHQWHCLIHNIKLSPGNQENLPYRQFMVCRPEVKKSELHPEEDTAIKITTDYFYGTILNEKGQIEDDLLLRKCIFFGGLEKSLRKTVWPFLLHVYSFSSTFDDRAHLKEIRRQEYEELTRRRLYSMSPEEQAHFWRNVSTVVEKDVVRTDRGNPYFAGDNNPNIETMKNILLNYAFYNSGIAYTQGMSDLLAPVLCEIDSESEAFWCFVGLMQRAFFVCTPTDNDIDKNLNYLRELIRLMIPKFHHHLLKHDDSNELLFCHRWLLLCFKREFTEAVAIRMWEACWSNYQTDYFHLFLCLAIICVYADDVIAQNLRSDEMLLHFSSLAMYMDGQLILRKARGLLHQYRQLSKIPCTLSGLCKRCGPGMWDSGHHPNIECVGHTDEKCSMD